MAKNPNAAAAWLAARKKETEGKRYCQGYMYRGNVFTCASALRDSEISRCEGCTAVHDNSKYDPTPAEHSGEDHRVKKWGG